MDNVQIQLPHQVIALAAAAMETAIHFELVDVLEAQSYCVDPVASGFAVIGRHGEDVRKRPFAAFICWDGASYIAIDYPEEQMVHILDVTTNIQCKSNGDEDTAALMIPVHRGSRTSYRPDMKELRGYLLDAVFETADMRQKRNEALIEQMDADSSMINC